MQYTYSPTRESESRSRVRSLGSCEGARTSDPGRMYVPRPCFWLLAESLLSEPRDQGMRPRSSQSRLDEVAISRPTRWCTVSLRSSGRSRPGDYIEEEVTYS